MRLQPHAFLMLSLPLIAFAAAANNTPLTAPALQQCANHALTLRTESARLLRENAALDVRRASINQRLDALQTERAALPPDDLDRGLALHERNRQYQEDARVFNEDIDTYKQKVIALNEVRQTYDAECADRSYQRSDLEALPAAAQDAMRRGLSDVQVPFLGNN